MYEHTPVSFSKQELIMNNSRLPVCKPIPRSSLSSDTKTLEQAFSLQHQELSLIKIKYSLQSINMIYSRIDEVDLKEYSFEIDLPMTDPDFPFDIPSINLLIIWPLNYPSISSACPKILIRDKQIPNALVIKIQYYLNRHISTCINQQNPTLSILQGIQQNLLEHWTLAPDPHFQSSSIKFIPAHKIQIQTSSTTIHDNPSIIQNLSINESNSSENGPESGLSLQTQVSHYSNLTHGTAIYFECISLTRISLVEPISLKLQLVCHRCKNGFVLSSIYPLPELNAMHICPNCKADMNEILFQSKQFYPSCISEIAIIQLPKAHIVDILLSEYRLTCDFCNNNTIIAQISKGQTKYLTCHNCNASLGISIQNIELRPFGKSSAISQNTRKRAIEKFVSIPGKPLPEYGICKHYKKSYRWLRFPCCGAAYPCDECHDIASEKNGDFHSIQWATRMICGFCSKEQSFSQTKPCSCGKILSTIGQKKTAFWEGGKGSRDSTTMSRKDSKKYRLMRKPQ